VIRSTGALGAYGVDTARKAALLAPENVGATCRAVLTPRRHCADHQQDAY